MLNNCVWKNYCKYPNKCCNFCKAKDCWKRCKDDATKCKHLTETIAEEIPTEIKKKPEKKEQPVMHLNIMKCAIGKHVVDSSNKQNPYSHITTAQAAKISKIVESCNRILFAQPEIPLKLVKTGRVNKYINSVPKDKVEAVLEDIQNNPKNYIEAFLNGNIYKS